MLMEVLMIIVMMLTSIARTKAIWCVVRSDASNEALQRGLDYACSNGANCAPIQSNGLCYLPNTIQNHASYAFNSFYQRNNMAPGSCQFSGTATFAKTDPSYGSCVYPASPRAAGGPLPPGIGGRNNTVLHCSAVAVAVAVTVAAVGSVSDPKMSVSYSPCFQPLKVFSRGNLIRSSGVLTLKRCNVVACMKKSHEDTSLEAKVDFLLDHVKWDDKGLAVAIAQNVDTGAILMQGFANREALSTTISSRKATFFSRSRSSLWTKGETSNNFINVFDVFLDCDRDSIIYLGKPDGPTCHTGSETCYYTPVDELLKNPEVEKNKLALTTLYALESTINQRKAETSSSSNGKPSWTKRLLLDDKLLCSKIREEADELCRTLEQNEANGRTASEMADVLYHAMVLLSLRGVKLEEVMQVLRQRFSKSGIEEKNSRKS